MDGWERAHRCERTSWSEYPPVNASQLKTQVDSAFTSMDANYNLDQLSNLYGEKVDIPSTLQCSNNPSNTADTATKAKAAYDKQATAFQNALKKTQ